MKRNTLNNILKQQNFIKCGISTKTSELENKGIIYERRQNEVMANSWLTQQANPC